jgi:hypothetical protein
MFVNDAVQGGYDRNLYVDYVEHRDARYETEAPGTLGTGSYRPQSQCQPAHLQAYVLHCNGYFQYAQP